MSKIKLGYKIGTSEQVFIKPSHMIVTGVTQLSGKTTTLESLLLRTDAKAIVFKTKPGERSFSAGDTVPPFFRDRSDYEFVRSLVEAYNREKLNIEKGTLMTLCKGTTSLTDIKNKIDDIITNKGTKLRGLDLEIYTRLQHYLGNLIPQIKAANLSSTLNILPGINIMNLERFSDEAQSLIIQAVAIEVLKTMNNVILVIPEAWKFLPQKYNNPCKRSVEEFIRQGAANSNFIWIDSQEMAGVDKIPLKQISTWILGYQSEINEVRHTLNQIPLPKKSKPKEEEIMNLQIGHFFLSNRDGVTNVYVQPYWMEDGAAIAISNGKKKVSDFSAPLTQNRSSSKNRERPNTAGTNRNDSDQIERLKNEIRDLRTDFFDKVEEVAQMIADVSAQIPQYKEIDLDELVLKVKQKLPLQGPPQVGAGIDIKALIPEIVKHLPPSQGAAVYQVAPLEKIRQNFLEEIKSKILQDIKELTDRQRKILKFVEVQMKGCSQTFIIEKLFFSSGTSSGTRAWVSKEIATLTSPGLLRKDKNSVAYPNLKDRISELMGAHSAQQSDMDNLYNHIMSELL
jgi:hypothetical protein